MGHGTQPKITLPEPENYFDDDGRFQMEFTKVCKIVRPLCRIGLGLGKTP